MGSLRIVRFRVIFLCLWFYGAILLSPVGAEEAQKAEITNLSGGVQVLLSGADDYTDAQEGIELEPGDTIRTQAGASAEVSFNQDNTNIVRVSENTKVEVSLSQDEKLVMSEGEVFASVNSLSAGSGFEIRTPTAVSGARGTDWVTNVTDEGTQVEAIDSQPYVRYYEASGKLSSQPTFITPGEMTTVKKFQKPTLFLPMPQGRRQQWQALKQDVRKRSGEALQKRQQRPPFNRNEFMQKMRQQKNPSESKPLQAGPQDGQSGPKVLISREGERPGAPQSVAPAQPKELTFGQPLKAQIETGEEAQALNQPIKQRQFQQNAVEEKAGNLPNQPPPPKSDAKGRIPKKNMGGPKGGGAGRR